MTTQAKKRRWLFLRSAHRGPERLEPPPIPTLDAETDIWCGLFARLVAADGGTGEIWKVGARAAGGYAQAPGLTWRRDEDLLAAIDTAPDVIFGRGGYPEYIPLLQAWPSAVRIYYGAGQRWMPGAACDGARYDLILVDTPLQRDQVRERYPEARVEVFHKPAAACFESAAHPAPARTHDVVFICNRAVEAKGCKWLAERLPAGTSVIRIGPPDPWFAEAARSGRLEVRFTGPLTRRDIPAAARRARVGVVCDDGLHDSGPRVLAELLAMDLPVLIRGCVRVDHAAYVPAAGQTAPGVSLTAALAAMLADPAAYAPRAVYEERFTLAAAAGRILTWIDGKETSNGKSER